MKIVKPVPGNPAIYGNAFVPSYQINSGLERATNISTQDYALLLYFETVD